MELVAGPPTQWRVVLQDGSVVDVWADAVEGLAGPDHPRDYSFGCLMDIEPALQDQFDVTARTPSNPRRVWVLVARFPWATVRDIQSQ
jgi:hypothetical protein